jgi:hypothetical protein
VADAARLSPLVPGFLLSLVIPFQLGLVSLQLSANRTFLLLAVLPLARKVLLGHAGKLLLADVALVLLCGWVGVSMVANHGLTSKAIEYTGIFSIETLGAFLLARVAIRSVGALERAVRIHVLIVAVLAPFAIVEAITGVDVLLRAANTIIHSKAEILHPRRLGIDRVQATFDHPIHFAIFCAAAIPLAHALLVRGGEAWRLGRAFLLALCAFLGLSSGAVLMLATQAALIGWDGAMRRVGERWFILVALVAALVAVELATGVFLRFVIDVVAFNPDTAFNRTRIFGWGLYNIAQNPWFGLGLREWTNLPGTSDSVDMFWIERGLMQGVPAALLNLFAFGWLFVSVALRPMPTARLAAAKKGYLVTLAGLFVASWTVHLWREIYVLYFFLLGSGAFLATVEEFVPVTRRPRAGGGDAPGLAPA